MGEASPDGPGDDGEPMPPEGEADDPTGTDGSQDPSVPSDEDAALGEDDGSSREDEREIKIEEFEAIEGPDGWTLAMDMQPWYEDHTGPRTLDESGVEDLEEVEGRLNLTEDGDVLENVRVDGALHVLGDDITVRNVVVEGGLNLRDSQGANIQDVIVRTSATYPVDAGDADDWTLEYCEIDGQESPDNNGGISGGGGTVRYCEFHSHTDSAKVGSNSVWEYNWLHSNGTFGTDVHVDGLQSTGASEVVVRRNYIDMPISEGANSAIIIAPIFGEIRDWTIEENYLNGGNFTVFARDNDEGDPQDVLIRNNRIGPDFRYGPFSTRGDTSLEGNVWADTWDPVEEDR